MLIPVLATITTPVFRELLRRKCQIGPKTSDVTYKEVADYEEAAWKGVEGKDWGLFQEQRPYSLATWESKAPQVGSKAPDGPALTLNGEPTTLMKEVKALGGSGVFVVLSFESLTCPVWRTFAGYDLQRGVRPYHTPVLHVYTREAHADDEFPASVPFPIKLAEPLNQHSSAVERAAAATKSKKFLEGRLGAEVSMILDSTDNVLERAYEARPFRWYIIDTTSNKVVYVSGPGPFNVQAKIWDIQAIVRKERHKQMVAQKEADGTVFTLKHPHEWQGKETKHAPFVTISGEKAKIQVGSPVPHGVDLGHYIDFIWAKNQNGAIIATKRIGKVPRNMAKAPVFTFAIPDGTTSITAFSSCNIHGVWSSEPVQL